MNQIIQKVLEEFDEKFGGIFLNQNTRLFRNFLLISLKKAYEAGVKEAELDNTRDEWIEHKIKTARKETLEEVLKMLPKEKEADSYRDKCDCGVEDCQGQCVINFNACLQIVKEKLLSLKEK